MSNGEKIAMKTLVAWFSATGSTAKLAKTLASAAGAAEAETIFLGFPIWWYREPSIIDSFLEAYDFSGKTIVPFYTSGGSRLGEGQERIEKLAVGAKVLPGRRFPAGAGEEELKSWIETL